MAKIYLKIVFANRAPSFYAPPPESGGVLCYTLRNFECPSVCLSVRPSVRPSVSAHHHSCIGNSSYSFRPILLKLYRCFKDGLKICILFFQNPEIIFYHFFPIFNLDIFRALILQICIWSMYLVSATPPTVFGESFWNFTVVFKMVWRYAYCFLRILKLFFLHFNLDIFSSLYATDMYREYMPCIGNPAYSFRPILLKLYRYFKDGLKMCIFSFQNPEVIFNDFCAFLT